MENIPVPAKRTKVVVGLVAVVFVAALTATALALLYKPQKAATPVVTTPIVTPKTPVISPRLVSTGLTSPVVITSTNNPSDKRLFVVEQPGLIRIISPTNQLESKPFLDIQSKVLSGGEMGLLGLAFHPHYKQNGYFYVNYIDKGQNTVIARYHVSTDGSAADPTSEKILFTVKQPYTNHNAGDLAFGPDGYLYAALGDGGNAGDPENRAQDKNSFFGKILRIDVNKGDPYSIPATNPFVNQTGTKPEIWAYGLRNPWRISFDSKTGDLYIADVGQGKIEEIDKQPASSKGGENYGWRCYEGSQFYNNSNCQDSSNYTRPIIEYDHTESRCSVTGGYVYRGKSNAQLVGKYFYSDFCSGQLFYADQKDGKWQATLALKTPYGISTFGQDSSQELYFADLKTGSIYQIQDIAN